VTFWDWLDKRWPNERGWVIILLAWLIAGLLSMAKQNPELWQVELFKTLLTATVITGALNMILAFFFAANKNDETKSENTRAAFDAITATANASGAPEQKPDVVLKPGETAQAQENA
jgi:hypothetical protein